MIMSSFIFTIYFFFFFFNDTAPTEIYPLSLPDALPFSRHQRFLGPCDARLIEKNIRPLELALGCVRVADGDIGPEPLQREKVRIHATASDHVATRGRQRDAPEAREHQIGRASCRERV